MYCYRIYLIICTMFFAIPTYSKEKQEITIKIQNHKFVPDIIFAKPHQLIRLIVQNLDNTIEEFESHDFHREKIIPGKSSVRIIVAPLKPGVYKFFGEFHEDTAQGQLIVTENIDEAKEKYITNNTKYIENSNKDSGKFDTSTPKSNNTSIQSDTTKSNIADKNEVFE